MFERPGLVAPDRLRRAYGSHRRGPSANPDPARSQGRKRAAQAAQPSDSENPRDRFRRASVCGRSRVSRQTQKRQRERGWTRRNQARFSAFPRGRSIRARASAPSRSSTRRSRGCDRRDDAGKLRRAVPQVEEHGEHVDGEREHALLALALAEVLPAHVRLELAQHQVEIQEVLRAAGAAPEIPADRDQQERQRVFVAERLELVPREREAPTPRPQLLLVHARDRAAVQTPVQIQPRGAATHRDRMRRLRGHAPPDLAQALRHRLAVVEIGRDVEAEPSELLRAPLRSGADRTSTSMSP